MIYYGFENLFLSGFLVLIFYAAGALVEKAFPVQVHPTSQRWLIRICLGMVVWIYLIFFLAACHVMYEWVLFAVIGMVSILFLIFRREEWTSLFKNKSRYSFRLTPAIVFFLASIGAVLLFLFVHALSTRMVADSHNYHLFVPKWILADHKFSHIPYKPIAHWPLNLEMLFLLALVIKDFVLAHIVHFLTGVFTLWALFLFGKEYSGRLAGMLAMILYLMNDVVRWIFPVCYTDLGIALFFFLSFWMVTKSLEEKDSAKGYLLLAGIFAGASAGCKLNAFVGGVAIGSMYIAAHLKRKAFFPALGRLLVYFGIPAVVLLAPWLIKSTIMTGNPVYPFLYDLFGGPEWNSNLSETAVKAHRKFGMGREPLDYLLLPVRVILDADWDFSRFYGKIDKTWLFLVPFSMFAGIRLPIVRRSLLVGFLFFIAWGLGTQQMRLLLPALTCLCVASAISVAHLFSWIKKKNVAAIGKGILLIAASTYLIVAANTDNRAYSSKDSQKRFLRANSYELSLFRSINQLLPPDALIYAPNVVNIFHLDRKVIGNNLVGVRQIRDLLLVGKSQVEIFEILKAEGITHIMIKEPTFKRARVPKRFKKLILNRKFTNKIFDNNLYSVFELNDIPPQSQ